MKPEMAQKAGRELDALVAERVCGWTDCDPTRTWERYEHGDPGDEWTEVTEEWCRGAGISPDGKGICPYPRYSEEISAAMMIVEYQIRQNFWQFQVTTSADFENSKYGVRFTPCLGQTVEAWADSLPHAICLAALRVCTNQEVT